MPSARDCSSSMTPEPFIIFYHPSATHLAVGTTPSSGRRVSAIASAVQPASSCQGGFWEGIGTVTEQPLRVPPWHSGPPSAAPAASPCLSPRLPPGMAVPFDHDGSSNGIVPYILAWESCYLPTRMCRPRFPYVSLQLACLQDHSMLMGCLTCRPCFPPIVCLQERATFSEFPDEQFQRYGRLVLGLISAHVRGIEDDLYGFV